MNTLWAYPPAGVLMQLCPPGGVCKAEIARIRTAIKPSNPYFIAVRGAIARKLQRLALAADFEYLDTHCGDPLIVKWCVHPADHRGLRHRTLHYKVSLTRTPEANV